MLTADQLATLALFVLVYNANLICFSVPSLLATELMGRGVVLRPLALNSFDMRQQLLQITVTV